MCNYYSMINDSARDNKLNGYKNNPSSEVHHAVRVVLFRENGIIDIGCFY